MDDTQYPELPIHSSVGLQPPRFAHHVGYFGQKIFFQRWREGNWRIQRSDPHDGSIEIVERLFIDNGRDLAGDAAGLGVLVQDDDLVGLLHRLCDGFAVEWRKRTQVYHFEIDAFFSERLRRFQRYVQHGGVGNHADVAALTSHSRLAQRHDVVIVGNFFLDAAIQKLVLEENYRVIVADGSLHESLGVVRSPGANHFQPRRVHEPHLRVL